jgi:hypothetical protein
VLGLAAKNSDRKIKEKEKDEKEHALVYLKPEIEEEEQQAAE